jgi:hypothetical protein
VLAIRRELGKGQVIGRGSESVRRKNHERKEPEKAHKLFLLALTKGIFEFCRSGEPVHTKVDSILLTSSAFCFSQRDHDLRMAYFNAAATEIQRHFRGFYSRRYKHSYYARAAYIAAVLQNTERLRAQLQGRRETKLCWFLCAYKMRTTGRIGKWINSWSDDCCAG